MHGKQKSTNLTLIDTEKGFKYFLTRSNRCLPLSVPPIWKKDVGLSILICLGRKRLQVDRRRKNGIWKCHFAQNEGKKCHASFPALAAITSFNPIGSLMLTSRGKRPPADRTWEANLLWHGRQQGQR